MLNLEKETQTGSDKGDKNQIIYQLVGKSDI